MTTVPEHQPESAPLTITVDGEQRTVGTGTSAADLYREDRSVVVARVNGVLKDLATGLADGDAVERVLISEPEGLEVLHRWYLSAGGDRGGEMMAGGGEATRCPQTFPDRPTRPHREGRCPLPRRTGCGPPASC